MADAQLDTINSNTIDSTGKLRPAISADSSRPDLPVAGQGVEQPLATETDTEGKDKGTETVVEAATTEEPAGKNDAGEYVGLYPAGADNA